MEIVTRKVFEQERKYWLTEDGTYYPAQTRRELVEKLEELRRSNTRVKVTYFLGDSESGYIGRSNGAIKSPLLIVNANSSGGGLLSTEDIDVLAHANKRNGGVIWRATSLTDAEWGKLDEQIKHLCKLYGCDMYDFSQDMTTGNYKLSFHGVTVGASAVANGGTGEVALEFPTAEEVREYLRDKIKLFGS